MIRQSALVSAWLVAEQAQLQQLFYTLEEVNISECTHE
jgi:hypothetical protein